LIKVIKTLNSYSTSPIPNLLLELKLTAHITVRLCSHHYSRTLGTIGIPLP